MKSLIIRIAFAMGLLAAASALPAEPGQLPANGLQAAPAIVNEVNVKSGTVQLWVHSVQHAHSFQLSPACLYDANIGTLAGVKKGMHVLVWTQPAQAGTLPVIYRLALQLR